MDAIRLGYADAALHEASAAAVARVLEAHELEVEYVPIAPGPSRVHAIEGGVDLFASAWLPLTDAALLASGRMQPLGVLYRPAFIWCVAGIGAGSIAGIGAGSIAESGVGSIAELADSAVFDRRILAPSGPIAALAPHVLRAYGLDRAGYGIESVSEQEAQAWAQAAGPGRIVPLCRPHELLHASGLRSLADPLGALGPEQQARMLIRHDLRTALDSDLIDELEALTLGNKVVSAMAHAMRIEAMSAEQAADAWQRGKLTPRG